MIVNDCTFYRVNVNENYASEIDLMIEVFQVVQGVFVLHKMILLEERPAAKVVNLRLLYQFVVFALVIVIESCQIYLELLVLVE